MNTFDLALFNGIHAFAGRWFLLDWLAIFVAVYLAYLLVIIFLVLVIKEKKKKKRAYAFTWALLSLIISRGIIAEVIRFIYSRPRPFEALGFDPVFAAAKEGGAFPSGHMTGYAIFVLPAFYLNRKWGWIYLVSVLSMGVARIYGGVHWPTDILGGLVIAFAVSYGVKKALFREEIKETKPVEADRAKTLE